MAGARLRPETFRKPRTRHRTRARSDAQPSGAKDGGSAGRRRRRSGVPMGRIRHAMVSGRYGSLIGCVRETRGKKCRSDRCDAIEERRSCRRRRCVICDPNNDKHGRPARAQIRILFLRRNEEAQVGRKLPILRPTCARPAPYEQTKDGTSVGCMTNFNMKMTQTSKSHFAFRICTPRDASNRTKTALMSRVFTSYCLKPAHAFLCLLHSLFSPFTGL